MIVLLESFWAYGTILAGIVAITVVANYGWRWGFAVGALPKGARIEIEAIAGKGRL